NPAGLAGIDRQSISGGAPLIAPSGGFTNDFSGIRTDLNDRIYPVPTLFYQRPLNERWAVGLGFFAPYGLETDWPEDFEGRFLGYQSMIQSFYIQPTAAVKILDQVSVGAGLDVTYMRVNLKQHLDLAEAPTTTPGVTFGNLGIPVGTDFADVELSGNGLSLGGHFGVLIQATDKLSFGARYLMRHNIEIDNGEVEIQQISTNILLPQGNPLGAPAGTPLDGILAPQFTGAGPLTAQDAATSISLPEQIVVGVAYQLTPELKLLFDYQRTNWKVFDELVLDFEKLPTTILVEDYEATNGYRFGGEYDVSPTTVLRAGFLTHDGAAPPQTVTPNLPEGDRSEFTLGVGTHVGSGFVVDLAYQYIDQADRRGRTTDGGLAVPTTAVNNGLYTFSAHLFGATLTYTF
ncbi:MAG: OmpP1/FadL family transporter, partial [Gemmatimonadales bacterium]